MGRLSESIAQRIRKAIHDGRLVPGEKLPAERELAEQLKTSRVSVREAYRSLEEFGLIRVKRGAQGGAFIAELDHAPVSRSLALMLRLGKTTHAELTEARLLLEPPVARLAALRAQPEDVARLRELVQRQDAAVHGGKDARRYDLEFHRLVAHCANNLPLMLMMNSMADLVVEAIRPIDIQREARRETLGFHDRILAAIEAKDDTAAYEIMREHVLEVQGRLGESLAIHLAGIDGGRGAAPRLGRRRRSRRTPARKPAG